MSETKQNVNIPLEETELNLSSFDFQQQLELLNHQKAELLHRKKVADHFSQTAQRKLDEIDEQILILKGFLGEKETNEIKPEVVIEDNTNERFQSNPTQKKFEPRLIVKGKSEEEAEAEYSEALFIYRRLAQTDPETFEPEVVAMLFCISTLEMEYFDDYETAEVGLTESLEIARRCAKKGDEILPTLASVLFVLSNWHISAGSCTQGEAECVEALKIYRRLDKISPGAFDEGKAMTLYNLGVLHEKKADKQSEVERAKKELSEALSIFRKLAETQYETYESRISKTTDLLEKLRNATDDSHSAN